MTIANKLSDAMGRWNIMPSGCWEWSGSTCTNGYGQFIIAGRYQMAHRVSWQLHYGPIPNDLNVLHRCDNRLCVNPKHLFLGTQQDNVHDMLRKGRRAIIRGSANGNSKLTEASVRLIKKRLAKGETCAELAREYDVSWSAINFIQTNRSWRHVRMALYNCMSSPKGFRITKFDDLGAVESSYLCSEEACECPAGTRHTCRHRTMLPIFKERGIIDSVWFYDHDRHDVVDLNGMTKATFDRIEAKLRPQGVPPIAEPATFIYTTDEPPLPITGAKLFVDVAATPPSTPSRMRR